MGSHSLLGLLGARVEAGGWQRGYREKRLHFHFSLSLLLESLTLKLQLKILIYLLKKIIVIYSGTICNLVLYFPSLL